MTSLKTRSERRKKNGYGKGRVALAVAGAVALGGLAGTTLALWDDQVETAAQITGGTVAWTVTSPDASGEDVSDSATSVEDGIVVTVPKELGQTLRDEGKIAYPVTIDIESWFDGEANLDPGLLDFTDGTILDKSDWSIVPVSSVQDCTTDVALPDPKVGDAEPVKLVNDGFQESTSTIFLCLRADLGPMDVDGTYTNKGTVTGTDSSGEDLTAEDSWSTDVGSYPDPDDQDDTTWEFIPGIAATSIGGTP